MNNPLEKDIKPGTPFNGLSLSAIRRRETHQKTSGVLYTGIPNQVIEMSNAKYLVAKDGSFRRIAKVA